MSKKPTKPTEAAETWYHQGIHAFRRGEYDKAVTLWQKSVTDKNYSANASLKFALAEAHFRMGQRLMAQDGEAPLSHLLSAASLQPQDAIYAYHVGLAYQRRKDFAQAITWLETALSHDPKFQRAAHVLAIALLQSGKDPAKHPAWRLLSPLQQVQIKHGDDQADQNGLSAAFHLLEKDQWEQAGDLLAQEANDANPTIPPIVRGMAFYYQGVYKQRQSDSAGAVTDWRKAAELGVDSPSLQHNLSVSYLPSVERAVTAENWDAAQAEVERALKSAPDNKRLRDLFNQIKFQQGYKDAMRGRWTSALQSWQAITGLSGTNARNLAINLAIAFEKLEQFEQAAEAWRDFVRRRARSQESADWLSPEQVSRLWSRIASLYQKAGKLEEAIANLQTALKYQADDVAMRVRLARVYAEADRFEAAHNEVDRALALAPQHIDALVLHAELTEFSPRRSDWRNHMDEEAGIAEWKAVLDTNDEVYAPVAREHLSELYYKQIDRNQMWGLKQDIVATFKEAVSVLPGDAVMRAEYIEYLLVKQSDIDEAVKQIALLDITDEDALIVVAAAWFAVESPSEAASLIQKAEAIKPLSPEFYTGLGGDLLDQKREHEAEAYFDEALRRTGSDQSADFYSVRLDIASQYLDSPYDAKGLSIIGEVLKELRGFGPALILRGLYYIKKNDTKAALKDLTGAEKWAREYDVPEMVQRIQELKMMLQSPFSAMLNGIFGGNPAGGPLPFDMDFDFSDDADEEDSLPPPMLLPRRGKRKPNKNG